MSLPWFPFNIKAYVVDTMRLSTEAHGAYLLLMLDYYETEEGPPDDDFILAAITKLPIESWKQHRKVLQRFFQIRDGRWHHERIEFEIIEGKRRAAASKLLAEAGGRARAKQMAEAKEKAVKTPAKPARTAAAKPQAEPPAKPQAEPQGQHTIPSTKEDSLSTAAPAEADLQARDEDEGIGSPIPPNWRPSDPLVMACLEEATQEEFEREVTTFVNRNLSEGGFSINWNAAFSTWWIRFKDHRAKAERKKAPARIEVNRSPEDTAAAMAVTIDRAVAMFAKGMQWSRGLGPEPGQLGCKIDPDIIRKHGIDPKTGMRIKESAS